MNESTKKRNWMGFSLRSFLFVVALLCAFLAGRASNQPLRVGSEIPIGDWKMTLPAGWERQCVITKDPQGLYELRASETLFNGSYELREGQLIMKVPKEKSAGKLIWKWDGTSQWVLIHDRTHASDPEKYIGARLTPWGYEQQNAKDSQQNAKDSQQSAGSQ